MSPVSSFTLELSPLTVPFSQLQNFKEHLPSAVIGPLSGLSLLSATALATADQP
jgi:hypothetical protein